MAPKTTPRRGAAAPLHAQIADTLRAELGGYALPPGTVLPSEAALCQRFGVARSVVRQALATLAAEGRIRREPGRPATVASPRVHRRLIQSSTGLFEQFAGDGILLRTQVLRFAEAAAPAPVAEFFGASRALVLERLRSVQGRPLAYVRTWLDVRGVPGLAAEDLEDASLHRVLSARYGRYPGRGRNRIRAVAADPWLAEALQVAKGSPLLMLEGQGMDQQGRPLEWFTTWHRAEDLAFEVDVTGSQESLRPQLAWSPDDDGPGTPADAAAAAASFPDPGACPSSAAPAGGDPLARAEQLAARLAQELARLRGQQALRPAASGGTADAGEPPQAGSSAPGSAGAGIDR